ncbi:ABC transporter permease [Castellaniella sp.]|uniref:ABC transporter permease n=1 Tax=Castellaniella sp. TaxID=1955812 RepID=UPI0035604CE4
MHDANPIHWRQVILSLSPAALLLGIFFGAYAIFLFYSVHPPATGGAAADAGWTLKYYLRYFASANERNTLWRTFVISVELTLACIVIGYPMAYVMVRSQSSFLRKFLIVSLVVTFLSGTVTRAYAWLIILGNRGLINTLLMKIGLTDSPLHLVYNETGVFISLLHFVLPFFVLTMMGPLKNIPRSLEDAAINLGAGRLRCFLLVTLPMSVPGLVAAGSLAFAVALSSFLFPLVLGGGRFRMVSNAIYEHIFQAFDVPMAAASASVFLVISLLFFWGFGVLQRMVGQGPTNQAH